MDIERDFPSAYFQGWLSNKITYAELEKLLKLDSCTLCQAVCWSQRKRVCANLEKPLPEEGFGIPEIVSVLTDKNLDEEQKKQIAEEGCAVTNSLYQVYNAAVRACHSKKLESDPEPIVEKGQSFIRYWVDPQVFLKWAYDQGFVKDRYVRRLYRQYVLGKTNALLELMIDLSREPENADKNAREIVESIQGQEFLNAYAKRKKLNDTQKETKKGNLLQPMRDHSDFGGKHEKKKPRKK